MGFKLDNFGTEVANAKGTLGGICYYRYRNSEGDDLTTPGYFPALLGLSVGDRIYVIPQDASNADDLYVVTSIANRTVEAEKVSSGGGGGGVIEPLVVTPSTSAQTIEAPEGVDGFSPVNVDAVDATIDANIVAGNIKNGVEILGVTGNYTGAAPALYRSYINEGGELVANPNEASVINLTGITYLTNYILYGAYMNNRVISGTVDMSDVETIDGYAIGSAFSGCTGITSVNLASLIRFDSGGTNAFANSGLTTVSMPSVEYMNEASSMFAETQLTTISLPQCYFFTNCAYMFEGVSTLTSADLSAVVYFEYNEYMFLACSSLASVDLSSAAYIYASGLFQNTALTTVSFPSFAPDTQWYGEHNGALYDAFSGISNITLHFPSNVQSIVEGLDGYSTTAPFGATAGSVAFDLPATYALEDQNGELLVRCPVKDTASSLAWFMWAQHAIMWTAGTTQPSVNDVLYFDPDLTNPSTLVVNSIIQ